MSPTTFDRHRVAAIVLAAGMDPASRELLRQPLGEATVAEAALANVRAVVDAERIVVVVAQGDDLLRDLLGHDLTYVEQSEAQGTGAAALLGLGNLSAEVSQVLVCYADTPLLRPDSLLGLVTRHTLTGADLSILTAVLPDPDPVYDRVLRADGLISAIVPSTDRVAATYAARQSQEVNVGGYVAAPSLMLRELSAMTGGGEYRLTEMAQQVIADGGTVDGYRIHDPDEVLGINTPEELSEAADVVLKRLFVPRKSTDTHIVFGTGGWRAVIGEGFTLANVRRLSQAIANEAIRQGVDDRPVVIGGDRRFLSRDAAEAAAEVFAGNNISVVLLPDDVPTPLVTFAVPHLGASYGIIITSSHNPPEWNGMKVFRADGSLPPDEESDRFQDEANALHIDDVIALDLPLALAAGVVVERGLTNEYVDAIEAVIDISVARDAELSVVVDPMFGTSQLTLGMVLGDMRVRAEFIHAAHNPLFGGVPPAPDLERLSVLIGLVRNGKGRYDLGLATDGDSDRIGIVDERGEYVTTNDLLLLLYWYLHEVRGQRGGVVRSLATTHRLDRLAEHFGEPWRECKVGFKYVTAAMAEIDAVLGGESSGGLTVRGWLLGKDGIFACSLVVEMLARTGRSLSELLAMLAELTGPAVALDESVPATPEMRLAVPRRLASSEPTEVNGIPVARVSYLDGTKLHLADGSWALLRFSGTEPALRLFVEAPTREQAEGLLTWLRGFATA